MTEILLPRIARPGTVCLISIRRQARKDRIERFELEEGFQAHHPPLPKGARPTPAPRSRDGLRGSARELLERVVPVANGDGACPKRPRSLRVAVVCLAVWLSCVAFGSMFDVWSQCSTSVRGSPLGGQGRFPKRPPPGPGSPDFGPGVLAGSVERGTPDSVAYKSGLLCALEISGTDIGPPFECR